MAALSEEDFQRLQENLLELKTRNYTLEEQGRKQRHLLGEAEARGKVVEAQLVRATRAVEKSKKAVEVQRLLQDCEGAQRKLVEQEEQMRLQNSTIMEELQRVVMRNEELEAQVSTLEKLEKRQLDRITDDFSMDEEEDSDGRDWKGEVREVRADLEEQKEEGRRWREEGEQLKGQLEECNKEKDDQFKEVRKTNAEVCYTILSWLP